MYETLEAVESMPIGDAFERKQITFRPLNSQNEVSEESPGKKSESTKIDLNARVIGSIVNVVHPSIIRNQNLFSTVSEERKHATSKEEFKDGKSRLSGPKRGQSTDKKREKDSQKHQENGFSMMSLDTEQRPSNLTKSCDHLPELNLSPKADRPNESDFAGTSSAWHLSSTQSKLKPIDVRIKVVQKKRVAAPRERPTGDQGRPRIQRRSVNASSSQMMMITGANISDTLD